MGLFKKEKKQEKLDPEMASHIHVMPKEFLNKPMTGKRQAQKEEEPKPKAPVIQTPEEAKQPIAPQGPKRPDSILPPKEEKSRWPWIVLVIIILLLIGGGFSYYFFFLPTQTPIEENGTIVANQNTVNEQEQEMPENTNETPETQQPPVVIPRILPSAIDTDNDGLTDVEEAYFQTDPEMPDMDEDAFPDGLEVKNLYNPTGFAPVRIIDSGLVEIYQHPSSGYELFVPKGWEAETLLENPQEVVITPPDQAGEFFNVQLIENPNRLPLVTWYIRDVLPGVSPTRIKRITNRRGDLQGILALDEQTAYFSFLDTIYAVKYNSGTLQSLNFQTTFIMMYESFLIGTQGSAVFPFLEDNQELPENEEVMEEELGDVQTESLEDGQNTGKEVQELPDSEQIVDETDSQEEVESPEETPEI